MSVSPTTSGCSEDENTATEGTSTEGGVMSVNSAIDDYIKMAKKRKTVITRKTSGKSNTEAKESEQLMLAIGRMYHCINRGRGILRRGSPPVNIIFNKHCSYQHMLERCISTLKYDNKNEEYEYYLADSKGVPIWTKDTISIDEETGEREIPWTLINYIHYSNVKYPSKARIYCVEKDIKTIEGQTDNPGTQDTSSNDGSAAPTANDSVSDNDGVSATLTPHSVQQEIVITTDEEHDGQSNNIDFRPLFLLTKKSLYRDALSTRITGQYEVLRSLPVWNEVDYARPDGHQVSIYPDNPCHHGFSLVGIDTPDSGQIELVETYNDDGTMIFKKPLSTDSDWGVWTGGQGDYGVAVLVALMTGGYHSNATYKWCINGSILEDETFPIIYVCKRAAYVCTCTFASVEINMSFIVHGDNDGKWKVNVPPAPVQPSMSTSVQSIQTQPSVSTLTSPMLSVYGHQNNIAVERLAKFSQVETDDVTEMKLLEVIGQGSYGTVYRASWRGSLVAAKVISLTPKDVKGIQIKREVEILRKLNHPHLASCLGIKESSSNVTIITPLVHGNNLQNIIFDENKDITLQDKFHILVQLCQAIVFLHTSEPPLAHLDVKPANVLVDNITLHTILTDFGLARLMSQTSSVGTKTMMAGSPGYQSPEQLRSESQGPPSDVYAFGSLMVVLFKEAPLWPGLTFFQIMHKVTNNEYPSTDGIPESVDVLCKKCFCNVASRLKITEVLKELQEITIH